MCIRDFRPIDCGPQTRRLARDYYGYTVDAESFTQATLIPAWNLIRSVVKVQSRFSLQSALPCPYFNTKGGRLPPPAQAGGFHR
jgi:hypothetical protein